MLNGYLALNLLVPAYIVYCHYHGEKPVDRLYRPFVFLSIFWAFAIHLVTAFLYRVEGTGFLTLALVATTLLVTGLLACCFPACRAAAVDPIASLRS